MNLKIIQEIKIIILMNKDNNDNILPTGRLNEKLIDLMENYLL